MQYYYSNDGTNQQGPVDIEGLKNAGITRKTLVWREGMSAWTPAGEVAEVADVFIGVSVQPAEFNPVQPEFQSQPQSTFQSPQPPGQGLGSQPLSYQGQAYAAQSQSPNGMAIASMVLGIIGILTFCVYCIGVVPAILAIIFGHLSRGQIRRGQGSGEGMALAGLILGYIAIGLFLVLFIIGLGVGIMGAATTPTPTFAPTYTPPPPVKVPVFPNPPTFPGK